MKKTMLLLLSVGLVTMSCFPSGISGPEAGAGGSHTGGRGGIIAPDRCVSDMGSVQYQHHCRLHVQASKQGPAS